MTVDESGDLLVVLGDDFVPLHLRRLDATTGACRVVRSSTAAVGIVPTPLVNGLVSLSASGTLLDPTVDASFAPAGVLRITATVTNVSSAPLGRPFLRVAELSNGNVLVSGDRPPDLIRAGGKGTRQTLDVGADGLLQPGESIVVDFAIGLRTRDRFTFFVDVFGEADPPHASP